LHAPVGDRAGRAVGADLAPQLRQVLLGLGELGAALGQRPVAQEVADLAELEVEGGAEVVHQRHAEVAQIEGMGVLGRDGRWASKRARRSAMSAAGSLQVAASEGYLATMRSFQHLEGDFCTAPALAPSAMRRESALCAGAVDALDKRTAARSRARRTRRRALASSSCSPLTDRGRRLRPRCGSATWSGSRRGAAVVTMRVVSRRRLLVHAAPDIRGTDGHRSIC